MQIEELKSKTVIELRKLARESGVKLSAGIDKEGIVQRLYDALGSNESVSPAEQSPASREMEPPTDSELQSAELSADVTSVRPASNPAPYRGWQESSEPSQPTYRQAWQARASMPRQPMRQPAWQPHTGTTPSRFGPQSSAPVQMEQPHVSDSLSQPARPPMPQQTTDGYRLGYRAAPQRDYGRQDYRAGGYRPAPRNDYQRPSYGYQQGGYQQGGYQQSGYQQQGYQGGYQQRSQSMNDAYYNDSLYKPVRDPAFNDSYDRSQPVPDLLQAGEGNEAEGVLEILPDGYGFLRSDTLLPGKKDIYVSVAAIRRYGLRTGDFVQGRARPQRDCDKFAALMFVEKLNNREPEDNIDRMSFDSLVPVYPNTRIVLENEANSTNWPMRLVDLIAPIGFGQRAMIIAPPESGKTILLREMSKAIKSNDPDVQVMMLLIDERPEEVTEIRDAVGDDAEVFATTFDEAPDSQTRVSETMLERAERLVEEGKNVVILLDSLTKLTRAYQSTLTQGGRAMTNTVTPAALVRPKRFFGAARNTRDGGSLTMIATIMVGTDSRVDDIIYEEFKGTANMEIWLNTPEENEPMFPVIDLQKSGTKKEDMLLSDEEKESLKAIRTVLASTTNREALVQLMGMMEKTKCNKELFSKLKDWVAMWEKSGFIMKK